MGITDKLKEGVKAAKDLAEDLVDQAEDAFERVTGDDDDDEPTYRERAAHMYEMMGEGRMLEAFDQYYHDDVVMIEGTGEMRNGKATSRAFLEQWMAGIKEMHGGGPTAITSDEKAKVTIVESWVDVTFQDGNRVRMEEVAVQRWKDGLVVHERFYYNAAPGQ